MDPKEDIIDDKQPNTIDTETRIRAVCEELSNMLCEKNRRYGDSALSPIRVFSKAPTLEQIRVRIDDKIKRIQNQTPEDDEDAVLDLIGYLILLRVAGEKL